MKIALNNLLRCNSLKRSESMANSPFSCGSFFRGRYLDEVAFNHRPDTYKITLLCGTVRKTSDVLLSLDLDLLATPDNDTNERTNR